MDRYESFQMRLLYEDDVEHVEDGITSINELVMNGSQKYMEWFLTNVIDIDIQPAAVQRLWITKCKKAIDLLDCPSLQLQQLHDMTWEI